MWLIGQDMTTNEHIKQQRAQANTSERNRRISIDAPPAVDGNDDIEAQHQQQQQQHGSRKGCMSSFYNFFFRPIDPSYFDLQAPLGSSVFKRTLVATANVARAEERRAGNLIPVAMPVNASGSNSGGDLQPLHTDTAAHASYDEELPFTSDIDHHRSRSESHSFASPSGLVSSVNGVRGGVSVGGAVDDPFDYVEHTNEHQDEDDLELHEHAGFIVEARQL